MKISTSYLWIKIALLVLVIVAVVGFFEQHAFAILKDVAKKNAGFLILISEIKMIISGISSINLPFISGNTEDLELSLIHI